MTGEIQHSQYRNHAHQNVFFAARNDDPYQLKGKLVEPTHCEDCGATYHKGRWTWEAPKADSVATHCPACSRIMDKVPAGFINLSGEFLSHHKTEIINLIKNVEQQEKQNHPLERIMNMEIAENMVTVSLTSAHIAQAIGEAINRAYKGDLDIAYNEKNAQIRINWSR